MPVEIRELQITTVVREGGSSGGGEGSSSSSSTTSQDAVISACVEQVLEILKQKNDR